MPLASSRNLDAGQRATAGRAQTDGSWTGLMAGLEDLYREIILDHYRSPRNRGELPSPPAHRSEGFNPLCGDEVVVDLVVEGGAVADIKIGGRGCSISQSSASLMSAAVKGKAVSEARALIRSFKAMMSIHETALEGDESQGDNSQGDGREAGGPGGAQYADTGHGGGGVEAVSIDDFGELAALQGVVKFPVRIKCATLPWNTLAQGLDEIEAGAPTQ